MINLTARAKIILQARKIAELKGIETANLKEAKTRFSKEIERILLAITSIGEMEELSSELLNLQIVVRDNKATRDVAQAATASNANFEQLNEGKKIELQMVELKAKLKAFTGELSLDENLITDPDDITDATELGKLTLFIDEHVLKVFAREPNITTYGEAMKILNCTDFNTFMDKIERTIWHPSYLKPDPAGEATIHVAKQTLYKIGYEKYLPLAAKYFNDNDGEGFTSIFCGSDGIFVHKLKGDQQLTTEHNWIQYDKKLVQAQENSL